MSSHGHKIAVEGGWQWPLLRLPSAVLLLLLWTSNALAAPVCVDPLIADGMVLQRNKPVPVWGTADAGTKVEVEFAGQKKTATADGAGKWCAVLDAMPACADARELIVRSDESIRIGKVLVGEVWVAAGQSNMEFPLAREAYADAELKSANVSQLRLLNLSYAGQNYFAKRFDPEVMARLTSDGFFRGTWQECTPEFAGRFSAVAYYFAKELQGSLKVPVGIIHLAVGGSPAEAWISRDALAADSHLKHLLDGNWLKNQAIDAWCRQRACDNLGIDVSSGKKLADGDGPNHPFKPGFLWEAGISRLIPFSIRGVIWYQGESNAQEARGVPQHERLFPLLVADWRKRWGIGEFPFLYCQLSSIGTEKGYRSQNWPAFRDSQRRMLAEIPNSGMVVTSDIGDPTDVHPRNKRDVGHRLALWALAKTYARDVVYSGPLSRSVRREGDSLVVTFDHADGGLATSDGKPPEGFEIAGADAVFHPASVVIGKDSVTLTSKEVPEPLKARYGWQPFSMGNLTNGAKLPASTFEVSITSP
jgi:sialate O-acetylesterase